MDELKTFRKLRVCVLLNLSRCHRKMNVSCFLSPYLLEKNPNKMHIWLLRNWKKM